MRILVATHGDIVVIDPSNGRARTATVRADDGRPTCLAVDPSTGRAWCGTRSGILRSDDRGGSWAPAGLVGEHIMSLAAAPGAEGMVWAGAEPSRIWCSDDGGDSWDAAADLATLPSSPTWAFPPKPSTHHVRWIAFRPGDPERAWVAIEAGALVSTGDGGRSWIDRVEGGPYDTHELAIHPDRPDMLRISAGDGYYESPDGGATWSGPSHGLDVAYLRSIAIDPGDPDVVAVSASSGPRSAYVAGRSDGRLYRREGGGRWERVIGGWPERPSTIAPLLVPGTDPGELWAADERGVHRSDDGGASWRQVASLDPTPDHLRGLEVLDG